MKAIVYTRYGPPDVLRLREVAKPSPGASEVLIKIHATTVNRTDCAFLRGTPWLARIGYGPREPKNTILGNEFAGTVESIGKDVTTFSPGDRVFGYNDSKLGAHTEYMTMPEGGMMTSMPANLTWEEAAPTAEGAHYALMDIRKANVRSGQRVLILGATGAIGSAALQLAKHFGADVTAVGHTRNMDLMTSLGADTVIDYTKDDFTKIDRQFDLVFDAAGKSSFGACKPLLKPGGIYCSTELGFLWQNPFLALWTSRFGSKKLIFPIPKSCKEDMVFFRELIEAGAFRPVIDRQYPLEQVPDAFRYVEQGHKTGNVVITVDHGDEDMS